MAAVRIASFAWSLVAGSCLLPAFHEAQASWDQSPVAFIVLRADAPGDLRSFADRLEAAGGHVSVAWPPRAAIAYASDAVLASPMLRPWIDEAQRAPVDGATMTARHPDAARAIRAFVQAQEQLEGLDGTAPTLGDRPGPAPGPLLPSADLHPPWRDAGPVPVPLGPPPPRLGKLSPRMPFGAEYYDTSEFLMGSCAVGVWLLEAAGAVYDWTSLEEDQTLGGIIAGLDNWVRKGGPAVAATFILDVHTAVPVSGVPIENPQSSDAIWVDEVLTAAGWTGDSAWTKCFAYNNSLRDAFETHWCYSIFVVDSSPAVNQGLFQGGGYAWAYFGGPWIYMSRYSTWAYNYQKYFAAVPMHETGHIFFATDEYDVVEEWSGYLRAHDNPNTIQCVMNRNDSTRVCPQSRRQIGWRDLDLDGIHDILDTEPTATVVPLWPDPTSDQTPAWSGTASVATIPNYNPNSHYGGDPHEMTIVTLTEVQCRLSDWLWTRAVPTDGAFDGYVEDFTWTAPPLPDGTYTLEARARSSVGNWTTATLADQFEVVNSPVSADAQPAGPSAVTLLPIEPNPVVGRTVLRFALPSAQRAQVVIYDTAGRRVRVLADHVFDAGPGEVGWDGRDDVGRHLPAGTYFCRLWAAQGTRSRKLVLVH